MILWGRSVTASVSNKIVIIYTCSFTISLLPCSYRYWISWGALSEAIISSGGYCQKIRRKAGENGVNNRHVELYHWRVVIVLFQRIQNGRFVRRSSSDNFICEFSTIAAVADITGCSFSFSYWAEQRHITLWSDWLWDTAVCPSTKVSHTLATIAAIPQCPRSLQTAEVWGCGCSGPVQSWYRRGVAG